MKLVKIHKNTKTDRSTEKVQKNNYKEQHYYTTNTVTQMIQQAKNIQYLYQGIIMKFVKHNIS